MADQTESSIVIAAPPGPIMEVIADLENYPAWSNGVSQVAILTEFADDGRPATARFRFESGPIRDVCELEYDWDGHREVSWWLTTGDMLRALDGTYTLHDNGDGTTTVSYRLAVDVKIPMVGMIKRKAEKVIVDTALRGLKTRVETEGA